MQSSRPGVPWRGRHNIANQSRVRWPFRRIGLPLNLYDHQVWQRYRHSSNPFGPLRIRAGNRRACNPKPMTDVRHEELATDTKNRRHRAEFLGSHRDCTSSAIVRTCACVRPSATHCRRMSFSRDFTFAVLFSSSTHKYTQHGRSAALVIDMVFGALFGGDFLL